LADASRRRRRAGDLRRRPECQSRAGRRLLRRAVSRRDRHLHRAGRNRGADDVAVTHKPEELTELNLLKAGVSTVIWATGYGLDYGWIDAPLLDDLGYPRNVRGVSAVPGLYFLGLLWQHSQASTSLVGPELDGPHLVAMMRRQARRRAA
jgi:putative flavoprotein involved in K+ transport